MRRSAILALTFLAASRAVADPARGLYQYRAEIIDVYDGDTITADIDLGFNTWRRGERLRLHGLDTPEVRGPDKALGIVARNALAGRILGKQVIICTIKDENSTEEEREKYGRYLAKVYLGDELVNEWMIQQGYGRVYTGGARQLFQRACWAVTAMVSNLQKYLQIRTAFVVAFAMAQASVSPADELKPVPLPYPVVNSDTWVLIEIWPEVNAITLSAYFMEYPRSRNQALCEAAMRSLDRDADAMAKSEGRVTSSTRRCMTVDDAVMAGYIRAADN